MIGLTYFITNGRIFTLKTPIELVVSEINGDVFAENYKFELLGVGKTEEDAREDAREDLGRKYKWKFDGVHQILNSTVDWLEMIDKIIVEDHV